MAIKKLVKLHKGLFRATYTLLPGKLKYFFPTSSHDMIMIIILHRLRANFFKTLLLTLPISHSESETTVHICKSQYLHKERKKIPHNNTAIYILWQF